MANSSTVLGLGLLCCVVVCVCLSSCASAGMFVKKGGLSSLVSGAVNDALGAATGGVVGGGSTGQLGQLTKPDGKCGNTGVKNEAGKCVPLTVESSEFGGSGGKYAYNECPDNDYISGINVGYDEANFELKYIAAGCADGTRDWSVGREAPSNLGKMIAGAVTMGISSIFTKDTGYDNRTWVDPAKPGWDQVAYITGVTGFNKGGAKGTDNRVRAFGPVTATNSSQATGMFGVNDNKTGQKNVQASERKLWRCDVGGKAPKGKRYALVGIGASTGTAVNRAKFKCRMFDVV